MVLDNYYELTKNMREISTRYFLHQTRIRRGRCGNLLASDLDDSKSFIHRCDQAFDRLEEEEREIINNEFFYQEYPQWWESRYEKNEFERRKKVAMKEFIFNYLRGEDDDQ